MRLLFKLFIFIAVISCGKAERDTIRIATSANMKSSMEKLISKFESTNGTKCEMILSSSGNLVTQIRQGAPIDVFVSADVAYCQSLFRDGLAVEEPKVYAIGGLSIVRKKPVVEKGIAEFNSSDIERIAIADPDIAPYGRAAKEMLITMGMWNEIQSKLVFGQSISQVNHFISTGAVDAAITAESSIQDLKSNTYSWTHVDPTMHKPIRQAMVYLNEQKGSKEFSKFLLSSNAKEILINHGYTILGDSTFEL